MLLVLPLQLWASALHGVCPMGLPVAPHEAAAAAVSVDIERMDVASSSSGEMHSMPSHEACEQGHALAPAVSHEVPPDTSHAGCSTCALCLHACSAAGLLPEWVWDPLVPAIHIPSAVPAPHIASLALSGPERPPKPLIA